MLSFLSHSSTGRMCDGSTRRHFLRVGAQGLGGLTLVHLLRGHLLDDREPIGELMQGGEAPHRLRT